MERNQFGFITLLAMLLAGAAIVPSRMGGALRAESSGVTKAAKIGSAKKTSSSHPFSGNPAITQICNFLGASEPGEKPDNASDDNYEWCEEVRSNYRSDFSVETLIATLPDPVETRLGYQFDNYLEAIEQAATASGYILERFDLTWKKGSKAETEESNATVVIEKSGRKSSAKPDPDSEPSSFLFRKIKSDSEHDKGPEKLLLLFAVGESPTRGVHRLAMLKGLSYADTVQTWWNRDPHGSETSTATAPIDDVCSDTRIIGPTYSGSVESIELVLSDWTKQCNTRTQIPKVHLVSGSATSLPSLEGSGIVKSSPKVTLETTIGQDADLYWSFEEGVLRASSPIATRGEIAVVEEGNTPYGTASLQLDPAPVELQFPLHIADLQKAAAKSEQSDSSLAVGSDIIGGRSDLPLAGVDSTSDKDLVPLFSASQTNTMDLQLDEMLRTLAERRIPRTIVRATDVHDVTFIAHKLKQCCPDSQLVVLSNSDLVFAHQDVNPDTRGALLVTSYPLFGENQSWTWPFSGELFRKQFPSDAAEGVYNATALLLNPSRARTFEYGEPFHVYEKPADIKKLVTWLTIVGNRGIWPVGILPDSGAPSSVPFALPDKPAELPTDVRKIEFHTSDVIPAASLAKICMVDAICAAFAILLLVSMTPYSPIIARSMFGRAPIRGLAMPRNFATFVVSTFVCVPPFAFAIALQSLDSFPLPESFERSSYSPAVFVTWISWFAVGLGLLATALCGAGLVSPKDPGELSLGDRRWRLTTATNGLPRRVGFTLSCFLSLGAIAGALCPLYAFGILRWPCGNFLELQEFFAVIRGLDFESGVSALRPVVLAVAAGIIIFLQYLRSQAIALQKPIVGPNQKNLFFDLKAASFKGIGNLETQVFHCLLTPFYNRRYFVSALVISLSACAAYLLLVKLPPVDGACFELCFVGLAGVVYFLLVIVFARLILTWRAMSRLLQYLFRHPSRAFYQKLHELIPGDSKNVIDLLPRGSATGMFAVSYQRLLNLLDLAETIPAFTALQRTDFALLWGLQSRKDSLEASLAILQEVGGNGTPLYNTQVSAATSPAEWEQAVRDVMIAELAMLQVTREVVEIAEPAWALSAERDKDASAAEKHGGRVFEECGLLFASRVGDFARNVLPQLHNYAIMGTIGTVLMLLAISSYTFPYEDTLLWFNWFAIVAAVGITVWVNISINRDNVLSLISGTTPGSVNWNAGFVGQLLFHGLIPILAILGVQFPSALSDTFASIGHLFAKSS